MIINEVRMVNFRGFKDKTVRFYGKPVVLMTAANGIGKTTTIDAIEWCLTGEIGRLKTAFDSRSTNKNDRAQNTSGILKHRECDNTSKVQVSLRIKDGDKDIFLCREQTKDEINADESKVTKDGNEDEAKDFIRKNIGSSFYNYHFCDVQKSISIQNKKRGDLESLFSEFITNYDVQKQIAENIEIFADDVERYIKDTECKKFSQELIDSKLSEREQVQKATNQIPYPETRFYEGENIEIIALDKDILIEQKKELEYCGYIIAKNEIKKLVDNELLKDQITIIKEIISFLETKGDSIREAMIAGLHKNSDTINTLASEIMKLDKFELSRSTIMQDLESIITYKSAGQQKKNIEISKEYIKTEEKKVNNLTSEIELLTNNNKMLELLTNLSIHKEVIVEYRNSALDKQDLRCPICGSATFATMDDDLILSEADEFIMKNGNLVKIKEEEKANIQKEIDSTYEFLIAKAKNIIEEEKNIIKAKFNKLSGLMDELKEYFEAVRKIRSRINDISVEDINIDNMRMLQKSLEDRIISEAEAKYSIELYQKILTVLGYAFADETLQQLYEKIDNLISKVLEVINFSYELFVSKINSIDGILNNKLLLDLSAEIEVYKKKNQELDVEISKLSKLKVDAKKKAQDIIKIVEKLSKDEYDKIGQTLGKFYNKLIRVDNNDGIKIVLENGGISLVDNNGKNIVNILSNGQISVFMLAYFFAGINARNKEEKMKIFFIDDLTSCMDDVNMLAFLDLLKYQLSSKKTMEQLFFVTCDNRISRLFKYKMDGQGIEFRELEEVDFNE